MSKHNKVNPDHYHQAGRLTPDELARERAKQQDRVADRNKPMEKDPKRPMGPGHGRDEQDRR